jgi:hypothetical protein
MFAIILYKKKQKKKKTTITFQKMRLPSQSVSKKKKIESHLNKK